MGFFDYSTASKYGTDMFSSQTSMLASQDAAFAAPTNWTQVGNTFGMATSVFGALSGAIGSMYAAKSQQSALKFQASMSELNARAAERSAQSILDQGQQQIGRITMQAGKVKSAQKAAMAANGIDLGEGNAAEVVATTDLMKETDALTISSNATRAASAARSQSVNATNQSLLQGVSANSISPMMSGATSLMTGASAVANTWYRDRRLDALTAALG